MYLSFFLVIVNFFSDYFLMGKILFFLRPFPKDKTTLVGRALNLSRCCVYRSVSLLSLERACAVDRFKSLTSSHFSSPPMTHHFPFCLIGWAGKATPVSVR